MIRLPNAYCYIVIIVHSSIVSRNNVTFDYLYFLVFTFYYLKSISPTLPSFLYYIHYIQQCVCGKFHVDERR
jgi:hypothetical protein